MSEQQQHAKELSNPLRLLSNKPNVMKHHQILIFVAQLMTKMDSQIAFLNKKVDEQDEKIKNMEAKILSWE